MVSDHEHRNSEEHSDFHTSASTTPGNRRNSVASAGPDTKGEKAAVVMDGPMAPVLVKLRPSFMDPSIGVVPAATSVTEMAMDRLAVEGNGVHTYDGHDCLVR